MITLRPYQQKAIDSINEEWTKGNKSTLAVMATGTGKTICFSKIIEQTAQKNGRTLVLAHRNELLIQAAEKLQQVCPLPFAFEQAEKTGHDSDVPVVIGSVQSMGQKKRYSKYDRNYFKTIIVDEAHHSVTDSYQNIINYFNTAKVLGVTATPERKDKKSLGKFYDTQAFEYSIDQAIKEKYLCPIKVKTIPLKIDISEVKQEYGDYSAEEVEAVLNKRFEDIAKNIKKECKNRKTVVFLPLIKTAQNFCKVLQKNGINAIEINGKTPDRDLILKDFSEGKYDVLCNTMLLTEGWDCPSVDCIVPLRPTRSFALYTQQIGRGTRLCEGKKNLLLLDFLWLTDKYDIMHPAHLLAQNFEDAKFMTDLIKNNPNGMDILEAEREAIDVKKEREIKILQELALRSIQKFTKIKRRGQKTLNVKDYIALTAACKLHSYEAFFGNDLKNVTDEQKSIFAKNGLVYSSKDVSCRGQAEVIIDQIKERAKKGLTTPKQIRYLAGLGVADIADWKKDDASELISVTMRIGYVLPSNYEKYNTLSSKKNDKKFRATSKQIKFLEKYGFRKIESWHYLYAEKMIERIKKLKGKLPKDFDPSTFQPKSKFRV